MIKQRISAVLMKWQTATCQMVRRCFRVKVHFCPPYCLFGVFKSCILFSTREISVVCSSNALWIQQWPFTLQRSFWRSLEQPWPEVTLMVGTILCYVTEGQRTNHVSWGGDLLEYWGCTTTHCATVYLLAAQYWRVCPRSMKTSSSLWAKCTKILTT